MLTRPPSTSWLAFMLSLAALCLGSAQLYAQAPAPLTMGYQGFLTDLADQPVNDRYTITFRLYGAPQQGEPLWEERHDGLEVVDGVFNVSLGSIVLAVAVYALKRTAGSATPVEQGLGDSSVSGV